jgi:hypothetical protein
LIEEIEFLFAWNGLISRGAALSTLVFVLRRSDVEEGWFREVGLPLLPLSAHLCLLRRSQVTNAFGHVLEEKLVAEKYLRASGLDYTIVRPGGLKSDAPAGPLYVRCLLGGKEGEAGGWVAFGRRS